MARASLSGEGEAGAASALSPEKLQKTGEESSGSSLVLDMPPEITSKVLEYSDVVGDRPASAYFNLRPVSKIFAETLLSFVRGPPEEVAANGAEMQARNTEAKDLREKIRKAAVAEEEYNINKWMSTWVRDHPGPRTKVAVNLMDYLAPESHGELVDEALNQILPIGSDTAKEALRKVYVRVMRTTGDQERATAAAARAYSYLHTTPEVAALQRTWGFIPGSIDPRGDGSFWPWQSRDPLGRDQQLVQFGGDIASPTPLEVEPEPEG